MMAKKTEWRCDSCHDRRDDDMTGTGYPQDRCLGTYVKVEDPPTMTITIKQYGRKEKSG